jgi:hypothetical protein
MLVIDPSRNWEPIEQRLEKETDPVFRHQLAEVGFHIRVEAELETERALHRLSPSAEYRLYDNVNPPVVLSGVDTIRESFYNQLTALNLPDLQWSMTRVAVDHGIVFTEGDLKLAMRGSALIAAGLEADADTVYLAEGRHLVLWPFDDEGRLIGEHVYYGYSTPLEEVAKHPLSLDEIGSITTHAPDLD